jgi:hypothetical protein
VLEVFLKFYESLIKRPFPLNWASSSALDNSSTEAFTDTFVITFYPRESICIFFIQFLSLLKTSLGIQGKPKPLVLKCFKNFIAA